MSFKEILPQDLHVNPFKMIGRDWMLVTAGTPEKVNTMTASWGGLGEMWNKPAAFVVIRPQRYTKEFIDRQEAMSLSFYQEEFREKLSYLGTVSGRDEDKIAKAGLTPAFDGGIPYFQEADTVMLVKKLYEDTYKPECFIEKQLDDRWYPEKDYHTLYICQVQKILVRE